MNQKIIVQFTLALVILAALSLVAGSLDGGSQIQDDADRVIQRDFMRTKLMFSQNIVEGLSVANYELIRSGAKEIEHITLAEGWLPTKSEELQRVSDELKQSAVLLQNAAEERNLEAAAMRYFQLTINCIDCHQMLRKSDF